MTQTLAPEAPEAPTTLVTAPTAVTIEEPPMRYSLDAHTLRQAMAKVKPAVCTRGGALPVLSGVRIDARSGGKAVIVGTDLELTIAAAIDAEVSWSGSCVLPFGLLNAMVEGATAKKSGRVEITQVAADEVQIVVGRRSRTLKVLPVDEWPRLAEVPSVGIEMSTDGLANVLPAASKDESRPILTGVLMGSHEGSVVATDSYRLYTHPGPELAAPILVPNRAITQVVKAGETTTLVVGEREVSFLFDGLRITSRLIEGEFPNYRGLIPASHPNHWRFTEPGETMAALKALEKFAEPNTPVRITPLAKGYELKMVLQDVGSETFEVGGQVLRGDSDLTVAFNPGYLRGVIEGVGEDTFVLETVDAQKPAVVRTSAGAIRLLMPVRVS